MTEPDQTHNSIMTGTFYSTVYKRGVKRFSHIHFNHYKEEFILQ